MYCTAARLKSASGLYCVKFFISHAHAKYCRYRLVYYAFVAFNVFWIFCRAAKYI